MRDSGDSLGLYIIMNFCIVLSPACYFAFNYIWFGRLVQRIEEHQQQFNSKSNRKHITFLPPKQFGKIFIISDVITFIIQAGGGGLQASKNAKNVGSVIFLVGIIAQFASYVFFVILSVPLARSLSNFEGNARKRISQLLIVLYFSSVWIIVSNAGFDNIYLGFINTQSLSFPCLGPLHISYCGTCTRLQWILSAKRRYVLNKS